MLNFVSLERASDSSSLIVCPQRPDSVVLRRLRIRACQQEHGRGATVILKMVPMVRQLPLTQTLLQRRGHTQAPA
jgi:hypothetical protein